MSNDDFWPEFPCLGAALSLLRERKGKIQNEVARAAGVGKSQLSMYEKGKRLPDLASLARVLRALELEPWLLFYTAHLLEKLTSDPVAFLPASFPDSGLLPVTVRDAFQELETKVAALQQVVMQDRLGLAHGPGVERP